MSDIKLASMDSTSFIELERELDKYSLTFPILDKLEEYLLQHGKLRGQRIGWHCHQTEITAASARVLLNAGAQLFMSECNPATSNQLSIEYMRKLGATIYCGADGAAKVLQNRPLILSDTGFVLIDQYLSSVEAGSEHYIVGGCEITSSGIQKLRARSACNLPVININDGELKTYIENFHGVGNGVIDALFKVTGRMLCGRAVAVAGYGRVGAGVASHLRSSGALVSVIESDPARKLIAHYDGFNLIDLATALSSNELLVTATGRHSLITADTLSNVRDGIILMNVGHWPEEIAYSDLRAQASSHRQLSQYLEEFAFAGEGEARKVLLLGGAGPANVVMCSGSIEPTLIHLVTEILCMNYLVELHRNAALSPGDSASSARLGLGENALPKEIQDQASLLALKALGLQS